MKTSSLKQFYLAIFLLLTGTVFKVMHWPFANIILAIGVCTLLYYGILKFYYITKSND